MATCPFCTETLPEGAERCPLCLSAIPQAGAVPKAATIAKAADDDAYELTSDTGDIPAEWQGGAVYSLELPARCPHCRELIRTLRVLRLKRTQVTFTSTLPRGGRILVCPECERIVSAELATL